MSMTKYGCSPEQTSKTASGAPGKKEIKQPPKATTARKDR